MGFRWRSDAECALQRLPDNHCDLSGDSICTAGQFHSRWARSDASGRRGDPVLEESSVLDALAPGLLMPWLLRRIPKPDMTMRPFRRPLELPIFDVAFDNGGMESARQVRQGGAHVRCVPVRPVKDSRVGMSQGDRASMLERVQELRESRYLVNDRSAVWCMAFERYRFSYASIRPAIPLAIASRRFEAPLARFRHIGAAGAVPVTGTVGLRHGRTSGPKLNGSG